ncbi:hypothetical protein D3C78_1471300 [compost metagenome]
MLHEPKPIQVLVGFADEDSVYGLFDAVFELQQIIIHIWHKASLPFFFSLYHGFRGNNLTGYLFLVIIVSVETILQNTVFIQLLQKPSIWRGF